VTQPPDFVMEMLEQDPDSHIVPPSATDHCEYEASRWPVFLPRLYALWEGHPDPTQNVPCDLRVEKTGPYAWKYASL
ncbi:MAG: glycogen debranching protein, partial [Oscillospiraceae bacterium]|nr:glycogen debranching protein [Oscillospiraceae bacterium]